LSPSFTCCMIIFFVSQLMNSIECLLQVYPELVERHSSTAETRRGNAEGCTMQVGKVNNLSRFTHLFLVKFGSLIE
jgi:hypothetical protein